SAGRSDRAGASPPGRSRRRVRPSTSSPGRQLYSRRPSVSLEGSTSEDFMALSEETRRQIEKLVGDNEVLLFMKGNRSFPQCGFSNRVVQILDALVPDYETVDVLEDPEIREGVKEFSSWPTIPQLYVKGEFI